MPIERHAVQEEHALRIDKDANIAFKLENMIAWPGFRRELELITETGAAASENAQPQSALNAFSTEGRTNFLNRFRCDVNLLGSALGWRRSGGRT